MTPTRLTIALAVATPLAAAPVTASACASCGCTLTSDWLSQGLVTQPGTTLSLRYDYVPQTVLRSGTRRLDRDAIALPADREIERHTYNHYLVLAADRQFASDWGLNLQVPFVYRPHATIAEDTTATSTSRTRGIGDVRLTARWQGFSTPGSINGLQFGLVLPTGRVRQAFRSGPAAGEPVDRGLQPGFGAVQAVLGFYRYGGLAPELDYIVQLQGQVPVSSRGGYRPGAEGQASAAIHYTRWRGLTPQLQLSARAVARDRGAEADRENSGGTQVDVSPGIIAALGDGVSAFTYVQLPLYRRVEGYQLTPRFTVSAGVQLRL